MWHCKSFGELWRQHSRMPGKTQWPRKLFRMQVWLVLQVGRNVVRLCNVQCTVYTYMYMYTQTHVHVHMWKYKHFWDCFGFAGPVQKRRKRVSHKVKIWNYKFVTILVLRVPVQNTGNKLTGGREDSYLVRSLSVYCSLHDFLWTQLYLGSEL